MFESVTVEINNLDQCIFDNAIKALAICKSVEHLIEYAENEARKEYEKKFQECRENVNKKPTTVHAYYQLPLRSYESELYRRLTNEAESILSIRHALTATFDSEGWRQFDIWRNGGKVKQAESLRDGLMSKRWIKQDFV